MFSGLRRRRKSIGASTQTADTNGMVGKHDGGKRRSLFDLFRRSRRKKNTSNNDQEPEGTADVASASKQTTSSPHDAQDEHANNAETAQTSTADAPRSTDTTPEYLTEDDTQKLFSGAPQFSAEAYNERIHISVSFPWDFDLKTRDLSDAKQIPHAAFSGSTLHRHLPRLEAGDGGSKAYEVGLVELPSMLASTGNEPGTVGVNFFVQEPDADILNLHVAANDDPKDVIESFSNFELLESQPEKLGIRKFDFIAVAERLVQLSSLYESTQANERGFSILNHASSGELYAALFGKILSPPKYDNTTSDPTGIKVQIETLLRILNLKRIWFDFSNVEWRIRVGQLLFSDGSADMADSNLSEPEDGLSERDVVLLQLLLACELYTRLEAVASFGTAEVKEHLQLTADDVKSFRGLESRKTKWDLLFARRFLDNIDAKTFVRPKFVTHSERSLTRTLLGMSQRESLVKVDDVDIAFEPRRQELQLNGLYYFAKELKWPDASTLQDHLNAALAVASISQGTGSPSIYATPLSTPGTMTPRSFRSNRESGYFAGAVGGSSPEMTPRSFQLQPPSRLDLNADASEPVVPANASIGGWLTRSYLTGLIMPGEAICHLLMSALLENDAESIAALGENANLYGGFVYKGRSFWSKTCVVGRVIACAEGSNDSMGWISSSIVPDGFDNGWLDVHSSPMTLKRIEMDDGAFATATDLLAGRAATETKAAQLTLPRDPVVAETLWVQLGALRLEPNTPTANALANDPILSANIDFNLQIDGGSGMESHNIPLVHLVQYVSAWPCTPPSVSILKRVIESENSPAEEATELTPAHPLHASYQYRQLRASDLLDAKLDIEQGPGNQVLVIDARGDAVSELLSRAWCSSVGLDALIARVGTTCLGCAIREASGLGLRVLIRIGHF
jgi:hypothetical protein